MEEILRKTNSNGKKSPKGKSQSGKCQTVNILIYGGCGGVVGGAIDDGGCCVGYDDGVGW